MNNNSRISYGLMYSKEKMNIGMKKNEIIPSATQYPKAVPASGLLRSSIVPFISRFSSIFQKFFNSLLFLTAKIQKKRIFALSL